MAEAAWDSREKWTTLLISRIESVLNSDQHDIKQWLENLTDFYDISECALQDTDIYESMLNDIEKLIYAKSINGRILTDRDRRANHEKAYKLMRQFFRKVHRELYEQELLIPFHQHKDPKRAIANYYEED